MSSLQEYRNDSGRRLFESGNVYIKNDNLYVDSESDYNISYKIKLCIEGGAVHCPCKDFEQRGSWLTCKHLVAADLYLNSLLEALI